MADKLMDIPNDDTLNYPLNYRLQLVVKMLDTQLNEPTNQKSISPQSCWANKKEIVMTNFKD